MQICQALERKWAGKIAPNPTPLLPPSDRSLCFSSHTKCLSNCFLRSQPPNKSVNLSFTITNIKNKLTDLCGKWLLQNVFKKTFCETSFAASVAIRCQATRGQLKIVWRLLPENGSSQGHNLALTLWFVPNSLNSGSWIRSQGDTSTEPPPYAPNPKPQIPNPKSETQPLTTQD